MLFYDTDNWQYLQVSYNEVTGKKYIQLLVCDNALCENYSEEIEISDINSAIKLAVTVNREQAQFYFALSDEVLQAIGLPTKADHLSDDYIRECGGMPFTGAFVGICAQDLDDHTSFADFSYFNYQEKEFRNWK